MFLLRPDQFELSNSSADVLATLEYGYPRNINVLTQSNMHLGLQQARMVLQNGDGSYVGAAQRHLYVIVLSDFTLRSKFGASCRNSQQLP